MKNFLQVNRALRAKKNFNFNFKHLFVLLAVLITCINTAWGEDITITPIYTTSYLSPGNLVKVTMGSNTSVSSGTIQVSKNTNGSFTISTSAPGMYLKSATFTDTNNGSTKAVTNLACTNGNIENSSGTCTYTANASTTSTTISFTGNTGGAVKLGSLSVVVTNGSLNNMETLSGFSCSSGTFSFTSKVNGSTVTSAVSLTTQTSSSWGASNGNISIPSSNDSKTLTITSSNNIRYVAILDNDCRLTLVEKSSTGGTCDGASWTAPSGVVNSVTFKNGIGTSFTATKVFVITEATSTYGIARAANSWNASNELMSGSGTVSRTLTLSANTNYEFKIVNTEGGGTWYGNGETWGGNRTQSVSSTGTANNCHLFTTDAGDYTFEFNTSTKDLTITYPNSYTYYYANTSSWSKVYVYKFTTISSKTGNNNAWPGVEIASPAFSCGGTNYYEVTSDGYAKLIFTNNNGKQTDNMTVSSSDEGKYVGGTGSSWSAMPTYTVTYNKNGDGAGGAGSVTGSVPTDASSPYSCGSDVTVKGEGDLALAGYYFNGWNTAAGGGGDSYAEGKTISGISANTILYAQWEAIPTYDVEFALTHVSYSSGTDEGEDVAAYNSDYSVTFEADPGFLLPDEITVTIDGDEVTEDTEYTWDQATGEVVVAGAYITGKIVITIVADEGPDEYYNEFVWKADEKYGGEDKCMDAYDANTLSTLTSGVITAAQSTATIVGGKDLKMDRPTKAETEFRLTFAVTQPGYYISFVCTYGKIEEEDGADYSWDGGTNWTHIDKYSDQKKAFDAPDGTYPTSFIIHYTLETAGSGGIYWRNAQLELAKIPTCSTPDAPTNFTAGSITATGLTFSITDEADAASYDIYYSTDDDEPDGSTDATTTSTSKSKDVTGLNMGTTYYAWVRAVCDDDHKSDWVELNPAGDTHTFTTSCVAPSALAAASPTAKGVTLSVTDANDVNDYEFYVSEDDEEPVANATATHSVTSSKSLTITNLVAGTTYYAWARSKCSANKSSWTALTNSTFTTSTVTVTHTLNNVTETSSAATSGVGGSDYTAVYAADEDYSLPTPVVTIDGNTATSGTDYTWVAGTGTITIPANKINGNIVITMNSAKAAPSSVSISGNYHIYPGDDLELTATPTGGNGPKTYQWQKYVDSDWENIEDETSATYTKANVTTSDVGHYRCIVTCAGTESTASGQYDVKCLQLYVYYNDKSDLTNVAFTKVDATHATANVLLGNSSYCYHFKVTDGCGNWWGNNGESGMSMSNHDNWNLGGNYYTKLWSSKAGTYTFNLGHNSGLDSYGMSVVFPSGTQSAGYNLYFANEETQWNGSKIYYRIGKTTHNNFLQMNLVPGTANLYKVTTTEYGGFEAWHIANNRCGGNSTSIYKTNTNDDYEASAAMMFNGTDIPSSGWTVVPDKSNHWTGDGDADGCEFYGYNTVVGMKTDRVTISDYSNGTITVNYTNTSNVASTLTSDYADLAHTVILTSITAVADEGYDASAVTINGGDYSANYVVTGATTIAATFSPQTYTITYKDQGDVEFSGTHETGYPTTHTYATGTTLKSASKTGYTFDGWFTTNACTGDPVTSLGATEYTADITLYAKWTADSYTITLNKGDHGAANQSASVSYDATSLTSITHVTSTGYDRTGYYDGETKVLNADGSFAGDNITGYITSGKWSKTSDAMLTAKWSAQSYTISYKDQGDETYSGSNLASLPTSHTYGAATALVDGVKAGYTFGGWYTDEYCTVSAGSSIGATAKTADFTLYAKWTEDECGITLTQFGTQYKTSSPRRLYAYTSNSFSERFIIETDGSNEHGVSYSKTDSLYLYLNNGKKVSVNASDVVKENDSIFTDVTKIKFKYQRAKSKSLTLTFDVYVGATKVGSVSQAVTDDKWYTETINVSPAKDGRVTFKNTGSSSDYALHFDAINICGTLPDPCTEITPTWSTDYTSTTLNVGATSSTPVVGKDGSSGTLSFSSSDDAIATVNSSGVVTAVKSGSVTITATVAEDEENNKCEGTVTKTFTIKAGITYNTNGADSGDAPTDATYYAANADITILGNTGSMIKDGKVFNGWNTKANGSGTHYEVGATMKMPNKSAGVTLYAEWVGYATSWEWWNSGEGNGSTTFTYLTNKNYVLSFTTNGDNKATWDISGGQYYRGVKLKTKDDNMSFWVQTGKRVSITFGTRPTKPTFTVGGVDKSSDVGASTNSDSVTVTYTTSADTKFYIENETSTGTAFTIKRVKIEDACTSITPSLNHSSKTLYAFGGTPRQVALVVSGNTGSGDVTWTSSDDGVATVTSDGLVTAVAPGTATITASIEASGDYCAGEAECTITVPALVTQTINVGNSEAAASWGTPPNMSFNDPTSTLTQNAVIDVSAGYTFDKTAEYKGNRSGRYMTAQIKAANGAMSDSKYLSLSFNSPSHDVRVGEVIVPIQPVTDKLVAKASISDGTTTVWSAQSDSLAAGSITDAKFTFSPTVLKAGTITVKVYVYGQPTDKGFRLANTICVNGSVLVDQRFTDANSTGLWSDPANWDGGSLPEIYHDVVIEKPVAVDIAHATAKSIVIYNNGSDKTGKLTIQPNKGLEVAGTIKKTTDGSTKTATGEADLVLESSSAGNASLIFNNSNSCAATVQMYSKAAIEGETWNWQYVGTPFTGSIPLYNYYGSWMYKWNNGWDPVTGGEILNPFVGYCLTQESATTHVMGGTLIATDGNDQEITMSASKDMVLANSWTAPIYIGGFTEITFTSEPATIYLFNTGSAENGSKEYVSGDEAGTYVTVPVKAAEYTGNELIAPMQGFFVTTNGGAEGTITMNYNDLVRPSGEHTDIVAGPMKAPKRIEERPEVMKIRAEGSVYNDRVVILSREDFSQGFDNGWDGKKMSFGNASPSVYVINEEGGYDAVSAIPEYEGTVVGFRAGTDSEYTIRFEYDGEEMLYLNDLQEQEATPIDSMRTYTFTAEAGDNEARFIISTTPIQKVITDIDPASGEQSAKVRKVIINDHIYIIRGGRMYSVDGALVK